MQFLWKLLPHKLRSDKVRFQYRLARYISVHTENNDDKQDVMSGFGFDDARLGYRCKTNWEVFRSWMILSFCKHPSLVDHSEKFIRLGRKVMGPKLFNKFMKLTFFGQFVAGENVEEIRPLVERMRKFGASVILNYAVEDDEQGGQQKHSGIMIHHTTKEHPGDVNLRYFLKCIDDMAEVTKGQGFAAIKVTALTDPETLISLTSAIRSSQAFVNSIMGRIPSTPVLGSEISVEELKRNLVRNSHELSSPEAQRWLRYIAMSGAMIVDVINWKDVLDRKISLDQISFLPLKNASPKKFTDEQRESVHSLAKRMDTIAEYAYHKRMRVLVDAEQSYFQPAIARISLELMRRYNKDHPTIYNTYQCYLKDAYTNMCSHLELSRRENFMFGAKERERAASMGYEDPINHDFESTSRMYEKVVETILHDVGERGDRSNIVIAGHNEATVRWAIQKLSTLNVPLSSRQVYFGQLLGMCDHISFTLADAGYNVVKCVPYGSVEEVIPYLVRRAHENRGFLEKTIKERKLLRQELGRRLATGEFFFYDPNASPTPSDNTDRKHSIPYKAN